jgi:hypothetical protein
MLQNFSSVRYSKDISLCRRYWKAKSSGFFTRYDRKD